MEDIQMGTAEIRFAELIWANEPVSSTRLVALAKDVLLWKKSTTYTVLKRLCGKGLFKSEGGVVTSLVKKEDLLAAKSERFVEETFGGSLPAFFAAFVGRKRLTEAEVEELRRIVADCRAAGDL